jgi:acetyl esterase/lipase
MLTILLPISQDRPVQWRTGRDPLDGSPLTRLEEGPLPDPMIVDGTAVRTGVIYCSAPGFRPLEVDLYGPERGAGTDAPRPLIVWIHGGAFAMGSRRLLPNFLRNADFFPRLVRAGFIVGSVDYRLSSEATWPAQILDVRAAIRWMRARSVELGVDTNAVAVWGESAGGHLALMAGMLGQSAIEGEKSGLPLPGVAAVVDWYGPTDFSAMDRQAPADSAMSHDDAESPESRVLGAPVQEALDLVSVASPITYARTGLPPILVRHGRNDRFVPFGQSEMLVAAVEGAGSFVRFFPVDDADHGFEGHPDPAVFIDEAIEFLREVMPAHHHDERVTDDHS